MLESVIDSAKINIIRITSTTSWSIENYLQTSSCHLESHPFQLVITLRHQDDTRSSLTKAGLKQVTPIIRNHVPVRVIRVPQSVGNRISWLQYDDVGFFRLKFPLSVAPGCWRKAHKQGSCWNILLAQQQVNIRNGFIVWTQHFDSGASMIER